MKKLKTIKDHQDKIVDLKVEALYMKEEIRLLKLELAHWKNTLVQAKFKNNETVKRLIDLTDLFEMLISKQPSKQRSKKLTNELQRFYRKIANTQPIQEKVVIDAYNALERASKQSTEQKVKPK